MQLHEIGKIKRVQVQCSSLKRGEPPHRYYDPAPLLVVARLVLTPHGAIGVIASGEEVMDIHHVHHPQTKNAKGKSDLSIGFTSHYAAMRKRFGEWIQEGCAGENILVEVKQPYTLTDLAHGLAIERHETGEMLFLGSLKVAAPCLEFSQYAANFGRPLPPQTLKETLQFLNDGQRGFYAKLSAPQSQGSIKANDRVFVIELRENV